MTTAHRNHLRSIMSLAWDFRRSEPARAFADCLRGAWSWTKRMTQTARDFAAKARCASRIDFSPSLIRSAIGNATRGQRYGGWADHKAASLTSRLGA